MKHMPFSWPFWSFWIIASMILVTVCLVMFFTIYPYLMRHLAARQKFLPYVAGTGAFITSGTLILIFYAVLPTILLPIYTCQAAIPSGVVTCPQEKKTIAIGGSTALNPLIKDAIAKYTTNCENATIDNLNDKTDSSQIQGSLAGLQKLSQGKVNIGTSDVFMADYKNFAVNEYKDYQIAIVKYVVIVNTFVPKNGVMPITLSTDALTQIYHNKDVTWGMYGGPKDEKIIRYARDDANSGTEITFRELVMRNNQVNADSNYKIEPSPQKIIQGVEDTPGAIGYVSSYDWNTYGHSNKAKPIKINGYSYEDSSNIKSNAYPFWNIEHLYIEKGNTNPLVTSFINFMGSEVIMADLSNYDYLALSQVGQNTLETRCPGQGSA